MLLSAVVAVVSVVVASAGVDAVGVAEDGCVVIISRGVDVSVREVMSSMAMEMKSRAGELCQERRWSSLLLLSQPACSLTCSQSCPILLQSCPLPSHWTPTAGGVGSLLFYLCAKMGFLHDINFSPRWQKTPASPQPWPDHSSARLFPENRPRAHSE